MTAGRSRKAYSSKDRFHHKQKSGLIPEAPKKTFHKRLLAGQNLQPNQTNPGSSALAHGREPLPVDMVTAVRKAPTPDNLHWSQTGQRADQSPNQAERTSIKVRLETS